MGRIRHADRTAGAVIGDRTLVHRRVTRTNAAHHEFFRNLLDHLRKSFAYCNQTIQALSDADMHNKIRFFGSERSVGESLYLIAGDMHEHLGQAIAYARMNHVVPPWTARSQQGQ